MYMYVKMWTMCIPGGGDLVSGLSTRSLESEEEATWLMKTAASSVCHSRHQGRNSSFGATSRLASQIQLQKVRYQFTDTSETPILSRVPISYSEQ